MGENPNYRGLEYCYNCDDVTGRAGRSEDSIYCDEHDLGPFCEDCYETHTEVVHDNSSPDYGMANWG